MIVGRQGSAVPGDRVPLTLVLPAWSLPALWLPLTTAYFLLVVARSRLTIRRRLIADDWKRRGEGSGPRYWDLWSTFPNRGKVSAAKCNEMGGLGSLQTKVAIRTPIRGPSQTEGGREI